MSDYPNKAIIAMRAFVDYIFIVRVLGIINFNTYHALLLQAKLVELVDKYLDKEEE